MRKMYEERSSIEMDGLKKLLCLKLRSRLKDFDELFPINHTKIRNVYDHVIDSHDHALFILFHSSREALTHNYRICQNIEKTLSDYNFYCNIFYSIEIGISKRQFCNNFEKVLFSVSPCHTNNIFLFCIGDIAPAESSNGKLCYCIDGETNAAINVISHERINRMVSNFTGTIPIIIFHNWIGHSNPIPSPDTHTCPNTFICYASNNSENPHLTHSHTILISLFEILMNSPNESLLLMNFYLRVRDHYFTCFKSNVENNYNNWKDILFTKNTLTSPLFIKYVELSSKTQTSNMVNHPFGLFFIVCSNEIFENSWGTLLELTANIKTEFRSMNYSIGENVVLTNTKEFNQTLTKNRDLTVKYNIRAVFIIVITTGGKPYTIQFSDASEIDVDSFSLQIADSFPNLPKVIIFSQVEIKLSDIPNRDVAINNHAIVLHSIDDASLSENSLIHNFALELKKNYYAELHSVLRSSIFRTTESSFIQMLDGFRKNSYINKHSHLEQLLRNESDEFKQKYQDACESGSESFKFYRLMVVGPEDVGKTSLLRVLTGQPFQEEEESTPFLKKYDLQVEKLTYDWSEQEDLDKYIEDFEVTRHDLAIKIAAHRMFNDQQRELKVLKPTKTTTTTTAAFPTKEIGKPEKTMVQKIKTTITTTNHRGHTDKASNLSIQKENTKETARTTVLKVPTGNAANSTIQKGNTEKTTRTTAQKVLIGNAANSTIQKGNTEKTTRTTVQNVPTGNAANSTIQKGNTEKTTRTTAQKVQIGNAANSTIQKGNTEKTIKTTFQNVPTRNATNSTIQKGNTEKTIRTTAQKVLIGNAANSTIQKGNTEKTIKTTVQNVPTGNATNSTIQKGKTNKAANATSQKELVGKAGNTTSQKVNTEKVVKTNKQTGSNIPPTANIPHLIISTEKELISQNEEINVNESQNQLSNIRLGTDDQPKQTEHPDKTIHSIDLEKFHSIVDKIESLRCKTDFFTAWDFAGQNYMYCFHSLFLSPRSVYLLLVDLTIKDLKSDVMIRDREDRHDKRSKSGVPVTYLQVYEFWLNAIYSVSKTIMKGSYYTTTKVVFVFSKADKVDNAEVKASEHFKTIKEHMSKRNNAFNLVHEGNENFILSCEQNSKYYQNISKLKSTIKQLSDQVAFEEPIPIKWLTLANKIMKEKQTIIDRPHIEYLAEKSNCTESLEQFLQFFNDIGFFFYKHGRIIVDIPKFLTLIYSILFPKFVKAEKDLHDSIKTDINRCTISGILTPNLFEHILDCCNLSELREPLLDLLLVYGILIQREYPRGFYIPYLLPDSLEVLEQSIPAHKLKYSFFLYFPDGFLPASIYFTLLSKCLRRNQAKKLSQSRLGFDCAVFYEYELLSVSFKLNSEDGYISVRFSTINDQSHNEEYICSEIMHYLIFLQLFLVEIQSTLIPSGNLVKVMFVCEECDTFSKWEKGERPKCSLDMILSINTKDNFNKTSEISKRFCCEDQFDQVYKLIFRTDPILLYINEKCKNVDLAHFIVTHRDLFVKHINWRELASTLYYYGLISIQRISFISRDISLDNRSEEFLMEMIHKGPLWAIKLYLALYTNSNYTGHRFLCNYIDDNQRLYSDKPSYGGHDLELTKANFNNYDTTYQMDKKRHGVAFIVNIETFTDCKKYPKRDGSNHDVEALRRVFENLQYDISIFQDLTLKQYLKEQKAIQRLAHSNYDSFFCVIMSHGNKNNQVIFSDCKPLLKDYIVREFSPRYCKGLEGKPKIFIFQACRGTLGGDNQLKKEESQKTIGIELLVDIVNFIGESKPQRPLYTTDVSEDNLDTFIGDSTIDKFVSFRSPTMGTFFIQSFCSVMQNCSNLEFQHIMLEVRRSVSIKSRNNVQCTEDLNRLMRQVYF